MNTLKKETVAHTSTFPKIQLVSNNKTPTQQSCALLGGSTTPNETTNPILNQNNKNDQMEIVPVVIVTKCQCCGKVLSKETVFMSTIECETYYFVFVEDSKPGMIRYENCKACSKKCDKASLTVVR